MEFADNNSPQVIRNPCCVKFITGNRIGTFDLDYDSLSKYDVGYMIKVSTLLRTKGFASKPNLMLIEKLLTTAMKSRSMPSSER